MTSDAKRFRLVSLVPRYTSYLCAQPPPSQFSITDVPTVLKLPGDRLFGGLGGNGTKGSYSVAEVHLRLNWLTNH
jgi:hypothetical protein